jgi:two-component system, chemotaxis family, protein-glutamate methylesterase/glutaminase
MTQLLVVDDSSFMRKSLTYLLESDHALRVVGTAADGGEAVRKVRQLRPDVVILDIEMSVMNGLTALTHIMAERPTPIIVLTGLNQADASIAAKCLEQGAVDVIVKPSGVISYDIDALRSEIIAKVKIAAAVNVQNLGSRAANDSLRPRSSANKLNGNKIVVIGASTGGPQAMTTILSSLPSSFAASVLIVQHMGAAFVPYFAESLKGKCPFDVAVAREDEPFAPGRAVVAPGDSHTLVARSNGSFRVRLSSEASPLAIFPSVDYAMASAAEAYGVGAVGVLLTGDGRDGALGMQILKAAGGTTLAADPACCLAPGMPQAAIDLRCIDRVLSLRLLAQAVAEMV